MAFNSVDTFSKKDLPVLDTKIPETDKVKRELIDCQFKQFLQYQCQHRYKTTMEGEDGKNQIVTSKVIIDSKKSDFKYVCFPFVRLFKDCKEVIESEGMKLYKNKRIEVTEINSNDELLALAAKNNRNDILKYYEYK